MRIGFDGTTLRPGRTGVGYYSEHLLHHMIEQGPQHEVVVVSNRPVEVTRPLPSRVRVEGTRWRTPRLVWMHTTAPRLLRRLRVDVAHFTNGMLPLGSPVPTVVTIHDMSLTLFPEHHPSRRVMLNRPFLDLAARRADAIITVSHSAKRDIVRHYGIDAGRVHVVTEAAAPQFRPVSDVAWLESVRRRYGLADRFILYVGTIEPRKNLRQLLEGFARRKRAGDLPHQLVCVGPYGWLCRDIENLIERLGIEDDVRFTGYVPFGDLPALYNIAEMFVFPSVYEGFGLPVIEAMACGTPTIIGPTAALVEVAGDAAEQVPHLDAHEIGDALVRLAFSRERREQLALLSRRRATRFSWERAARETLDVYRWAAGGARGTVPGSGRRVVGETTEAIAVLQPSGAIATDARSPVGP